MGGKRTGRLPNPLKQRSCPQKKKCQKVLDPYEVVAPVVVPLAKAVAEDARGADVPETNKPSLVSCARAGVGARAFGKKTKGDVVDPEVPAFDPLVRLQLDTGGDNFEEITADTRALLEIEVSRLCRNAQELASSRAKELQVDSSGESAHDPIEEEERRISSLPAG